MHSRRGNANLCRCEEPTGRAIVAPDDRHQRRSNSEFICAKPVRGRKDVDRRVKQATTGKRWRAEPGPGELVTARNISLLAKAATAGQETGGEGNVSGETFEH
jgi:hypothetical protein